MEAAALVGPPPEAESELERYDPLAHLATGERYAKSKEELRALRQTDGMPPHTMPS